jgi:hypothetical protein
MNVHKIVTVCCIGLVMLAMGCAGARTMVKADGAKYDVSLSRAIRDSSGVVIPSERLEEVGIYHKRAHGWGILWSCLPLNSIDLSNSVNDQVEKAGGNAIINLSVKVRENFVNSYINWVTFWVFTMFPVYPYCSVVDFTGKIVKIKPAAGGSDGQTVLPVPETGDSGEQTVQSVPETGGSDEPTAKPASE